MDDPKQITRHTNKTLRELSTRYTGCDDRNFRGSKEELEALFEDAVIVQRRRTSEEVRVDIGEGEMVEKFIYWFRQKFKQN